MQTFEIGGLPSGIYRFLVRNNRRVGNQAIENNHYWVTDICKWLRQSYYELSNTPSDAERKEENEAEHLWSLQSAKYLHNLTNSYRWRELDIEKEIFCQEIDEKLYIVDSTCTITKLRL